MRKLAALVTSLAAAVAVPAASAAGPSVVITPWNSTRVIPAGPCPFAILVHSEGTIRDTFFEDGRHTTILHDFHIVWTNMQTGKALTTALGGPQIVEPNGDGTVTVMVNGNNGNFVEHGEGPVFSQVGRIVYLAAADDPTLTPIEILKVSGRYDTELFPAICEGLT